jgi:hypothetical protein
VNVALKKVYFQFTYIGQYTPPPSPGEYQPMSFWEKKYGKEGEKKEEHVKETRRKGKV